MKVNIGTYSFGGIASYLGLGPTLLDNSAKCYSQLDCGWAQNGGCYPPSFIHTKKGLLWGTLRKEGAPRLLCFKFNNSCVKSV